MQTEAPSLNTLAQPGEVGLVQWQDYVSDEAFVFESGQSLPGFTLRYESYGRLNAAKDNAILVCHALSGDHHCAGFHSLMDRRPGWWNSMIGPGKPLDTNRYCILCSNCLGGCQGSTGPSAVNPATGEPYYLDFPLLTIRDMVAAQERWIVEGLGIERLFGVIGGSMGGMQALQWAVDHPERVDNVMALATTARQSAQAIAFNEVGRLAILQDPHWDEGRYDPHDGPNVGLSVARMMAHITYLSDKGLEAKFGRERVGLKEASDLFDAEFQVERYLRYQGRSFTSRFDANTYLYLTKALDRFDLYGPSNRLEDAFRELRARVLLVGFTSDWLYPPEQNRAIAHALLRCGKDASYVELDMELGHDSFLVDSKALRQVFKAFLRAAAPRS